MGEPSEASTLNVYNRHQQQSLKHRTLWRANRSHPKGSFSVQLGIWGSFLSDWYFSCRSLSHLGHCVKLMLGKTPLNKDFKEMILKCLHIGIHRFIKHRLYKLSFESPGLIVSEVVQLVFVKIGYFYSNKSEFSIHRNSNMSVRCPFFLWWY